AAPLPRVGGRVVRGARPAVAGRIVDLDVARRCAERVGAAADEVDLAVGGGDPRRGRRARVGRDGAPGVARRVVHVGLGVRRAVDFPAAGDVELPVESDYSRLLPGYRHVGDLGPGVPARIVDIPGVLEGEAAVQAADGVLLAAQEVGGVVHDRER